MTKRGLGIVLGLLAALYCTTSVAVGILKLSRTEMTLAPDKPPGELWVENKGDTPLYLDVTQQLVANPGQTPERLVPVEEVQDPGFLVLPRRLTLSPGQKYRMTLKELDAPQRAQVWRVTFRPKERIVVDASDAEGRQAPLLISVGYGVVIYQLTDRNEQ
jgi:P pilus assembly chaperone PapD